MFDIFGRPDWDSYFISQCFLISQRSIDQHTKVGCVVVDDEHTILSTGYNSPPRGSDDTIIPLTRPEKYPYMEHAESNAIINAARNGISLKGSTFYITTHPCENCFRKIRGIGAKRVVFAGVGAACLTEETMKIIEILNAKNPTEIVRYNDTEMVKKILENVVQYHDARCKPI